MVGEELATLFTFTLEFTIGLGYVSNYIHYVVTEYALNRRIAKDGAFYVY